MNRAALLVVPLLAALLALVTCRAHEEPVPDASRPPTPAPEPVADAGPPAPEPLAPRFSPAPAGERLVVLSTHAVQGYVTPCGCTAEPLGGVARLAGLVDEARAAYGERVLFLDAGDLLFERADDTLPADRCQAEARVELLLDTYARKGLAATALGPLDDVRGAAFRDARLKARGVPTVGFVPERLGPREGLFERSIVRTLGGVTVGVTGFRADTDEDAKAARAFLEAELKALRAQARFTVVLAQAARPRALEVLAELDADLALLGHDPGEVPRAPERAGERGPTLVSPGAQAQHIGVVEVSLEGRGAGPLPLDDRAATRDSRRKLLENRREKMAQQVAEAEGARKDFLAQRLALVDGELAELSGPLPPMAGAHLAFRALPLTRRAPVEEKAASKLASYEAAIPSLVRQCEADITCPEPAEDAPTYVGVEACYLCHKEAVKFWQQQKVVQERQDKSGKLVQETLSHARAWETLVDIGKDSDRECIGCHSIGFNEPGGYCKAGEVDFRINVQCESCHGPGSIHADSGGGVETLFPPAKGEAVCRRCHKVPHIPTTESFVYEEKVRHILGPGHGAERLEAILTGEAK